MNNGMDPCVGIIILGAMVLLIWKGIVAVGRLMRRVGQAVFKPKSPEPPPLAKGDWCATGYLDQRHSELQRARPVITVIVPSGRHAPEEEGANESHSSHE